MAGLTLAQIGSSIGPVSILVQGQAWRWVWITVLASVLVFPTTALQVWQEEKCGPLCVLLLISGWTLPTVDGTACVSIALLLWLARDHVNARDPEHGDRADPAVQLPQAAQRHARPENEVTRPHHAVGRRELARGDRPPQRVRDSRLSRGELPELRRVDPGDAAI